MTTPQDALVLYGQTFASRLLLGTSRYPSPALLEAAVQRARPVVLTALAAMLAFIPLTHDRFWGPLADVLIGGVAVGTAITLLFVPALYALWFRITPDGAAHADPAPGQA